MAHVNRFVHATLLSGAVVVAFSSLAGAQTRSSITGKVTDTSGAVLRGVTVTLSSPDLVGGAQSDVTGPDGVYRFTDLPPGTYKVTAALDKFQTVNRTNLRLQFGTTIIVDVSMPLASVVESVTVGGTAPTVDVTTAAATTKADTAQLENLPLVSNKRQQFALFEIAPGAHFRTTFGAAQDSNNLTIDGNPSTLPQRQGTNPVVINVNYLQEVQVVSLGANAEYGEFTGVASNMIVRSGSNNLSGMGEYSFSRPGWLGNNVKGLSPSLQSRLTPPRLLKQWDTTLQAGGPLKRDKLFIFASWQYLRNVQISTGSASANDSKWPRFASKIDWAASRTVRVSAYVTADRQLAAGGTPPNSTAETSGGGSTPTRSWSGRVAWTVSNRTLVELKTGGLDHEQVIEPLPPNTRSGPPPRRDRISGIACCAPAQFRIQDGNRAVFGGSVIRFQDGWAGLHHELKAGLEYEWSRFKEQSGFPGGLSFTDAAGVPETVVIWAGDTSQGDGHRTSMYAQDTWTLTPRVTILPGLRITLNRGSVPDKGNVFSTNPIDPRIGFAWDMLGDHKTVARAHYGRFHDGLATTLFDFLNSANRNPRITATVLGPNNYLELTRSVPSNTALDPNVTHSYMDQFTGGVGRELFADFSVDAQFIERHFDNILAFVDRGSQYAIVQRQDPGPDGRAGTADDGGLVEVYNLLNPGQAFLVLTNPDRAYRRYRGIQFVAKKRYSHNWQLQVGYTFSRTRGSVGNGLGDNVAFGPDTSTTGSFVNPNLKIKSEGLSVNDIPHMFQVHGSYRVPYLGGFLASAVYRLQSGSPWGRTAVLTGLAQGTASVRIEPRGTRRTPRINNLDLRLEKMFPLARSRGATRREAGIFVDFYNVGNQGVTLQGRVTEASGATLGDPLQFSTPRTMQMAFRLTF